MIKWKDCAYVKRTDTKPKWASKKWKQNEKVNKTLPAGPMWYAAKLDLRRVSYQLGKFTWKIEWNFDLKLNYIILSHIEMLLRELFTLTTCYKSEWKMREFIEKSEEIIAPQLQCYKVRKFPRVIIKYKEISSVTWCNKWHACDLMHHRDIW